MPLGIDEELMSDQMNGLARSDEERRKRSLVEAMLGSLAGGGDDMAQPLYRDFKDAGPTLMGAMMGNGRDPGLMNGAKQSALQGVRPTQGPARTVQAEPIVKRPIGPREFRMIAENPEENLNSTVSAELALKNDLNAIGKKFEGPEARDIPGQKRAKDEAALQRDLGAREKIGDLQASSRSQSRQVAQSGAQRGLMKALLGDRYGELGRSSGREEAAPEMVMRELNDQLKPSDNRLGGIRQAERGTTRDSRMNESFARKLQGSAGEDKIATDEFEANKARMAAPNRKPGKYAKGVNQPQNLSDDTRSNLALSRDRGEARSLAAMLGMDAAREGRELTGEESAPFQKSYLTAKNRFGPTVANRSLAEAMSTRGNGNQQPRGNGNGGMADKGKIALMALQMAGINDEKATAAEAAGNQAVATQHRASAAENRALHDQMLKEQDAGKKPVVSPEPVNLRDRLSAKPKPVVSDMQMFVKRQTKKPTGGRKSNVAPQDPDEWKEWFRQALVQ